MNRAEVRSSVDHAVAFANSLIIFGWSYPPQEPQFVTILDGRSNSTRHRVAKFKSFPRPDVRQALALGSSAADEEIGFAAAVDLSALLGLQVFGSDVGISVESNGAAIASGTVSVLMAPIDGDADSSLTSVYLTLAAQLGLLDTRLSELIKTRSGADATRLAISHAIDFAGRSNSGFVVEGWIANARASAFSFLSTDGLVFIPPSEVIYKARADVTEHLRAEKQALLTDDHGVLLSFAHCLTNTDSFLVLRDDARSLTPIARIKVAFSEGRDRLLEFVSHAVGGGKFPRPAQAKKYYLPFFVDAKRAEEFTVNWIKAPKSEARVSIVVPLFREYRFIFSLLTMQKKFSDDYEWLFVSDDPTQHQILTHILERRSYALSCPTALIVNRFNYGYAASNNIGASVARGKTLLFMNSDVWVDSQAAIDRAEKIMGENSFQIVGFRLLYEDGTIQHDGMSFRHSNLMHNLLLVDHPRKGTPPDDDIGSVTEVPAVTGALLMMGKEYFLQVGQFDRAYIKGDFEDADLCLKVRWLGGRIGLYKTNDIYHLERQSIRLMGGESSRLALTYLNCITFNERWSNFILQRQAPGHTPGANVAQLAAQKKVRAV